MPFLPPDRAPLPGLPRVLTWGWCHFCPLTEPRQPACLGFFAEVGAISAQSCQGSGFHPLPWNLLLHEDYYTSSTFIGQRLLTIHLSLHKNYLLYIIHFHCTRTTYYTAFIAQGLLTIHHPLSLRKDYLLYIIHFHCTRTTYYTSSTFKYKNYIIHFHCSRTAYA